jgi:prepilin-type processing-associated H-X9-DG protein
MRPVPSRETGSRTSRRGVSRVEVVVVMLCLALIVLLAVPLISVRTQTQRAIACRDRLGRLGAAFLRHADDRHDTFPVLEDGRHPWTVAILPYYNIEDEDSSLLDRVSQEVSFDAVPLHARQYLCPNGRAYPPGANSYVVNGGYGEFKIDQPSLDVHELRPHTLEIDWDHDGSIGLSDLELSRATGVIWRPHEKISPWTRDEISARDGLPQTILLSENQNAARWQSRETFDLAFVVDRDRIMFGPDDFPFAYRDADLGPYRINFSRSGREGKSPAPGATHGGFVNVAFADGSAQPLSEAIDPLIYLRLLTPAGAAYGEAAPP